MTTFLQIAPMVVRIVLSLGLVYVLAKMMEEFFC